MPRYSFLVRNTFAPEKPLGSSPVRASTPSLENYPRVLDAIKAMWGYEELNDYFRKLTIDDRGVRDGFPPEVWEEIYLLQKLHQQIAPDPIVQMKPRSVWA